MINGYTDEKNTQILISLLKKYNIKFIVASPGTTNIAFVASVQYDPFFTVYSVVDERSAAYVACGLAYESQQPVVLSCTGATASRNYLSGLTEAFYRKLPVLAVTSTQDISKVGHHIAQVIDRNVIQNDVARMSILLRTVTDKDSEWECEIGVNKALAELNRNGGGPVHINLTTTYSQNFTTKILPEVRMIRRVYAGQRLPELGGKRVAFFIGAHSQFSEELTAQIDRFCELKDAVVFCDHTSGYSGKYKVLYSIVAAQRLLQMNDVTPDILVHLGEVSGDYSLMRVAGGDVWRVSEDGEMRDSFRGLQYVFEMKEESFFEYYLGTERKNPDSCGYFEYCYNRLNSIREKIPSLPFSNIWIASKIASKIPAGSTIHLAILNSLRAWNFFEFPADVKSISNVGGFGIDGCLSSLIGASLLDRDTLYFGIIGDLAFFYDMNVMGNRHISNNVRIMLVNNGKGVEFRLFSHYANNFGDPSDEYIAAACHFGNKSCDLVRHYAIDNGFKYLSASNKEEFLDGSEEFLSPLEQKKPVLFEVFIDAIEEDNALRIITSIESSVQGNIKQVVRNIMAEKHIKGLKKIMKK